MSNYYTCNITAQEIKLHAWLHVYIMAAICSNLSCRYLVHCARIQSKDSSEIYALICGYWNCSCDLRVWKKGWGSEVGEEQL